MGRDCAAWRFCHRKCWLTGQLHCKLQESLQQRNKQTGMRMAHREKWISPSTNPLPSASQSGIYSYFFKVEDENTARPNHVENQGLTSGLSGRDVVVPVGFWNLLGQQQGTS